MKKLIILLFCFVLFNCSGKIIRDRNDLPRETIFLKETEQITVPVVKNAFHNYRVCKYANQDSKYYEERLTKSLNNDESLIGKNAKVIALVPEETGKSFNGMYYHYPAYNVVNIENQYLFILEDNCKQLAYYMKNKTVIDKKHKEIEKANEYYLKYGDSIRSKYNNSECFEGGFDYYILKGNEATIFPEDSEFAAIFSSPSYAKLLKEHLQESKNDSMALNHVRWSKICGKWSGSKTFLTRAGFYRQLKILKVDYIEFVYPNDNRIFEKGK